MDALKGMEKTILENVYEEKKKKLELKFNPGLALIGPRTTGPWLSHLSNVLKLIKKIQRKLMFNECLEIG